MVTVFVIDKNIKYGEYDINVKFIDAVSIENSKIINSHKNTIYSHPIVNYSNKKIDFWNENNLIFKNIKLENFDQQLNINNQYFSGLILDPIESIKISHKIIENINFEHNINLLMNPKKARNYLFSKKKEFNLSINTFVCENFLCENENFNVFYQNKLKQQIFIENMIEYLNFSLFLYTVGKYGHQILIQKNIK